MYDAFNIVNRKGKMPKRYLSPAYVACAQEYREMRKELNTLLRKKRANRNESETSQIEELRQRMKVNAQQQIILLQDHLRELSSKILSNSFRFTLTPVIKDDPQKPLYTIGENAEEFFAMQVLCRNVKKLFRISMSSRNEILSQLKLLLREDKSRYYLIRTDVCGCYESIPHDKLFYYLDGSNLLDAKSKSLLHGLIRKEYETKNMRLKITASNTGIPRGCAISSFLSEFYLSKIDEEIKRTLPGIVFMARYVDDIIIVVHPHLDDESRWSLDEYLITLSKAYNKHGLTIHTPNDGTKKCYAYDSNTNKSLKFDLLGYTIQSVNKEEAKKGFFSLTAEKKNKIKKRIIKTFQVYDSLLDTKSFDVATHYLFDALHVLTSNINLFNAKRGVKVGIFYSNQLLDNMKDLEGLDKFLQSKCRTVSLNGKSCVNPDNQTQIEETLKTHLQNVSFVKGFGQPPKRYKIKKKKLQMIKKTWL